MKFDDEDKIEQPAPKVKTAEDYEKVLNEKSAAPEDWRTKFLPLLQTIGSVAKDNGRASDFIGQQIQRIKDENKAKQKLQLDNYLKSRDMTFQDKDVAWEDKSRSRKEKEWSYDDEDRLEKKKNDAPDAPRAAAAKLLVSKKLGIAPSILAALNYKETLDVAQLGEKARQEGAVLKAGENADGSTTWYMFDPNTKQITNTGIKTGYARGFDSVTGQSYSKNDPNETTIQLKTEGGVPLAKTRTQLEGERANARKMGTETAEATVNTAAAGAKGERIDKVMTDATKLYDAAAKEPLGTGPVAGRVGNLVNEAGFSTGPASNALRASLASERDKMMKEMSGAQVTAQEQARILQRWPQNFQQRELFMSNMQAVRNESQKAIAEAKAKQRNLGALPQNTAPASSGPKEIRKPYKGRTAVFNSDTKEFIRYED